MVRSRKFVDDFNAVQREYLMHRDEESDEDYTSSEAEFRGLRMTHRYDGVVIEDADREGDIGVACVWIQRYLDRMDIDLGVYVSWSTSIGFTSPSWCTYFITPREADAFSGGGAVVDRNQVVCAMTSSHVIGLAESKGSVVFK